MSLTKGKSREAFSKNVKTEMAAGKPQKQAVAIAYAVRRRSGGKAAKRPADSGRGFTVTNRRTVERGT